MSSKRTLCGKWEIHVRWIVSNRRPSPVTACIEQSKCLPQQYALSFPTDDHISCGCRTHTNPWLSPCERRHWAEGAGPPHTDAKLRLFGTEGEPRVVFYRDTAAWCPYCQKVTSTSRWQVFRARARLVWSSRLTFAHKSLVSCRICEFFSTLHTAAHVA